MDRVTVTIDIDTPVQDVFDYVAEQRNYTTWCPKLSGCELTSDGLMEVGATKIMSRSTMGMNFNWEFTCDEYDPPNKMVWRSDNDERMRMVDILEFEAVSGRTKVVHHLDMTLGGFLKWMKPLALRRGRKDMMADLVHLKEIMESRTEAHQ
ncbi:MAG: SRPBCC family protein [Chloroflexi bacterium]|nr:SRPBCC family protein [Chloroflexota bacterium]